MTLKEVRTALVGKRLFMDGSCVGRIKEVRRRSRIHDYRVITALNSYEMPWSFLKAMAEGEEVCFVIKYYVLKIMLIIKLYSQTATLSCHTLPGGTNAHYPLSRQGIAEYFYSPSHSPRIRPGMYRGYRQPSPSLWHSAFQRYS